MPKTWFLGWPKSFKLAIKTEAVFDLNRADPDALKLQRPLHDGKLGGGTQRKSAGAEQESVGYFSTKSEPGPAGQKRFRDPGKSGSESAVRWARPGMIGAGSEADIRSGRKSVIRHVWLSESLRRARQ